MADNINIFMVEDDRNFGTVMKSYLEINGFDVTWVQDGADASKTYKTGDYNLCILDVMLPNIDGFQIGRKIKEVTPDVPLIFLTAKTLKDDILEGYEIGADEYITKPFDSEILIAKIKAILNRRGKEKEEEISEVKIGSVLFNYELRTITTPSAEYRITPKEAELLKMLYKGQNNLLHRDTALEKVWGEKSYFTTRSMDVYISKLRKYFSEDNEVEIINIPGSGYQLRIKNPDT